MRPYDSPRIFDLSEGTKLLCVGGPLTDFVFATEVCGPLSLNTHLAKLVPEARSLEAHAVLSVYDDVDIVDKGFSTDGLWAFVQTPRMVYVYGLAGPAVKAWSVRLGCLEERVAQVKYGCGQIMLITQLLVDEGRLVSRTMDPVD